MLEDSGAKKILKELRNRQSLDYEHRSGIQEAQWILVILVV